MKGGNEGKEGWVVNERTVTMNEFRKPDSNEGLMWLIYRVDMNSLERQSVEFSKITDIPELFPTMDLICS